MLACMVGARDVDDGRLVLCGVAANGFAANGFVVNDSVWLTGVIVGRGGKLFPRVELPAAVLIWLERFGGNGFRETVDGVTVDFV